jgi:diacylglycerol kinase
MTNGLAALSVSAVGMCDLLTDSSWSSMLMGTLVMLILLKLAGVTNLLYYLVVIMPLFFEGMNCAIESAVDFTGTQRDEKARRAKDMAAATVALTILLAVVVTASAVLNRLYTKYYTKYRQPPYLRRFP